MKKRTKDAAWRTELTDDERRDLEVAALAKKSAVEKYNTAFARLKNRCIKRLRRKAERDALKFLADKGQEYDAAPEQGGE